MTNVDQLMKPFRKHIANIEGDHQEKESYKMNDFLTFSLF